MSERANLRAQRAKIRPETADLRLRWPKGGDGKTDGRKDGWKERRAEGQMDISKFPPVSYRTLALWGRCPETTRYSKILWTDGRQGVESRVRDKKCFSESFWKK